MSIFTTIPGSSYLHMELDGFVGSMREEDGKITSKNKKKIGFKFSVLLFFLTQNVSKRSPTHTFETHVHVFFPLTLYLVFQSHRGHVALMKSKTQKLALIYSCENFITNLRYVLNLSKLICFIAN